MSLESLSNTELLEYIPEDQRSGLSTKRDKINWIKKNRAFTPPTLITNTNSDNTNSDGDNKPNSDSNSSDSDSNSVSDNTNSDNGTEYRNCLVGARERKEKGKLKLCPEGYCTAKLKFEVYPSAYANGWAAKNYKGKGGTWKNC